MKSLLAAATVLALTATAPLAQTAQTAGRTGQIAGACGQPLALSYTLSMPVDQIAAAPLDTAFVRAEPVYLEFTLAGGSQVTIRTQTGDSDTDPYLTLFNARGEAILSDDDGVGDYNAQIATALDPGTYCAQARPVSGSDLPQPLTLVLATGAAAEDLAAQIVVPAGPEQLCTDPALTEALDRPLGPGLGRFSLQTSVDPQSHRDWQIAVTAPMDLQIDATSGQFDTQLTLVDASGNLIAENDDAFPSNTDSRIVLAVAPGDYCLSLAGYEGGSGLAEITLTDTPDAPLAGPIEEACTDPALTRELGAIGPGLGRYSLDGELGTGSRSDWRFDVTGETLLQFDALSEDFDTLMTLLDSSGQMIEQNDDEPNSVNSRITRTLLPGSYCLAIEGFGGGSGRFVLEATDTPSAEPPSYDGDDGFCSATATTSDLGAGVAPGFGAFSTLTELAGAGHHDFAFQVSAPIDMRMEARSGDFDTVLRLASSDGSVLAENDDGPNGTDSSLDYTLSPGQYCLRVESFAGGDGSAELSLSERDASAVSSEAVAEGWTIPGPDAGVEIDDLGPLADRLETSRLSQDQTKWVAFTLESAATIRVDAIGLGGPFALRLFSETGERLNDSQSSGGISPARIEQHLPAGRYFLAVAMEPYVSSRLRNIVITRTGG